MTPAARYQAAIDILDHWLSGDVALEQALTGWARRSRFAGSKDRAAVRDIVFDAARRRRSDAALGGAKTGRGLILGALRRQQIDPQTVFGAGGHAPSALTAQEQRAPNPPASGPEALDVPDWLWPRWQRSLADRAESVARAWQTRAPVHLRVNMTRGTREVAREALCGEGITTEPHPACDWALTVTDGARKLRNSHAYKSGAVELQDAASQALVAAIPGVAGARVLDYCAGGGGKSLALAMMDPLRIVAHDADPRRMRDLPDRAARAGATVDLAATIDLPKLGPFDIILCDVPCSGSGSWRRAPDGKWRLNEERLVQLTQLQSDILHKASALLRPEGLLVYATCSVLRDENHDVVDVLPGHTVTWCKNWVADDDTDGFFTAHLHSVA